MIYAAFASLVLVIIALCALLAWKERENRLERAKMLNAIIAKTPEDAVNLNIADKTEVVVNEPPKEDYLPLDDLTDEELQAKLIEEQDNG